MYCEIKSKSSSNVMVPEKNRLNRDDLNKIKKEFRDKSNKNNYKKILNNLELLLEGQEVTQKDLQLGFIGLAKQNSELLDLNKELNQQLEIVIAELDVIKKEREYNAARQKAWSNRKRLPKRDPINSEIYNLLIKESEDPSYIATRTRIAICLLTVTRIRISDLLSLKIGQLTGNFIKRRLDLNRSIEKGSSKSQSLLNKGREKTGKGSKKRF